MSMFGRDEFDMASMTSSEDDDAITDDATDDDDELADDALDELISQQRLNTDLIGRIILRPEELKVFVAKAIAKEAEVAAVTNQGNDDDVVDEPSFLSEGAVDDLISRMHTDRIGRIVLTADELRAFVAIVKEGGDESTARDAAASILATARNSTEEDSRHHEGGVLDEFSSSDSSSSSREFRSYDDPPDYLRSLAAARIARQMLGGSSIASSTHSSDASSSKMSLAEKFAAMEDVVERIENLSNLSASANSEEGRSSLSSVGSAGRGGGGTRRQQQGGAAAASAPFSALSFIEEDVERGDSWGPPFFALSSVAAGRNGDDARGDSWLRAASSSSSSSGEVDDEDDDDDDGSGAAAERGTIDDDNYEMDDWEVNIEDPKDEEMGRIENLEIGDDSMPTHPPDHPTDRGTQHPESSPSYDSPDLSELDNDEEEGRPDDGLESEPDDDEEGQQAAVVDPNDAEGTDEDRAYRALLDTCAIPTIREASSRENSVSTFDFDESTHNNSDIGSAIAPGAASSTASLRSDLDSPRRKTITSAADRDAFPSLAPATAPDRDASPAECADANGGDDDGYDELAREHEELRKRQRRTKILFHVALVALAIVAVAFAATATIRDDDDDSAGEAPPQRPSAGVVDAAPTLDGSPSPTAGVTVPTATASPQEEEEAVERPSPSTITVEIGSTFEPSSFSGGAEERVTTVPSRALSYSPTFRPSYSSTPRPSDPPSLRPSGQPSGRPSPWPSWRPSSRPSFNPSGQPTGRPSSQTSSKPSDQPTGRPSAQASSKPSGQPTGRPPSQTSSKPSSRPTGQPLSQTSSQPSSQLTGQTSLQASSIPDSQPSSTIFTPSSSPSTARSPAPSSVPPSASPYPTETCYPIEITLAYRERPSRAWWNISSINNVDGMEETKLLADSSPLELRVDGELYSAALMEHSVTDAPATGRLCDCALGIDACDCPGGVCLLERGQVFFDWKVANCERGGGVAAIVYNNVPGSVFTPEFGSLGVGHGATIPALFVSRADGRFFAEYGIGRVATIRSHASTAETICLLEGDYEFRIYHDALLPWMGENQYNVTSDGVLIAEGGDFFEKESRVRFSIPFASPEIDGNALPQRASGEPR